MSNISDQDLKSSLNRLTLGKQRSKLHWLQRFYECLEDQRAGLKQDQQTCARKCGNGAWRVLVNKASGTHSPTFKMNLLPVFSVVKRIMVPVFATPTTWFRRWWYRVLCRYKIGTYVTRNWVDKVSVVSGIGSDNLHRHLVASFVIKLLHTWNPDLRRANGMGEHHHHPWDWS